MNAPKQDPAYDINRYNKDKYEEYLRKQEFEFEQLLKLAAKRDWFIIIISGSATLASVEILKAFGSSILEGGYYHQCLICLMTALAAFAKAIYLTIHTQDLQMTGHYLKLEMLNAKWQKDPTLDEVIVKLNRKFDKNNQDMAGYSDQSKLWFRGGLIFFWLFVLFSFV